ncbi:MAG: hypothetical protein DI537_05460 [Stutzerimonas stutzeri]|nr:MAG: hypothetical protein DI537_05460 [Stutzerimonas stutzeri]
MNFFHCSKRASKDNKDGLVLLQLKARPSDIPPAIKFGTHGDRYTLTISVPSAQDLTSSTFEGQRVAIDDMGDGSVNLKIAALPSQVGDAILYAPNGCEFAVAYEPLFTSSDIVPITPEHRRATFKRLMVISQEPAFWDFLEKRDRWSLLHDAFVIPSERPSVALEVLYRLVKCHSRADILTNAAVCERTERLIREFRSEQWNAPQGALAQR